jgi:hypothetical protein
MRYAFWFLEYRTMNIVQKRSDSEILTCFNFVYLYVFSISFLF